ncbi:zinc-ribbon domain-containing protein [Sinomicrobium kalidii]|uniref:zinc-ribbon domain-containing protein n=1 Tax=Sinomicrobium kalidii TaxID=2900738 RepID=UPI00349E68A2
MIIFGTRGISSTQTSGKFHCPQCNAQQSYKRKKVTKFFTLYFIPLIPLGKRGEYVECTTCKTTFYTGILGDPE